MASRGKLAGMSSLKEPSTTKTSQRMPSKRSTQQSPAERQPSDTSRSVLPAASSPSSSPTTTDWSPSRFEQAALMDFDLSLEPALKADEFDELLDQSIEPPSDGSLLVLSSPLDPYNIPMELKYILNYHLLEVAPKLCVDNTTIRNPYSQFILQLAVEKPPLLYACAALAASHRSVRLSNETCKVDCWKFRGKAMRRLQEQLWSDHCASDDGNITTILMLTLTDMCLGDASNFDAHFGAAKRLIDLRGANRTQDTFVEQYIAWLDIMCAANNRRKALFTSEDVASFTGPTRQWSHDVFPCPPDQFGIVSEVIALFKTQSDPLHPTREAMAKAHDYKRRILSLPMHIERGEGWLHLTEAFRHAIALYIIRIFRVEADEDELSWLIQSVFYHSKLTTPSTGWTDHLLWPLFHAGLEVRDEHRQQWLRDRSVVMQQSGGFRNVETSMKILEQVWSSGVVPDYTDFLPAGTFGTMLFV
ncbi:hypothetical protein A1O3_03266 [Capronia epimyces CBS 606.96]|uniref:Transcription factor domain-containing protein n=1 Tax=Capronia epimyces CBS 606.96 TaxID=1182542 RepID=W9Y9I6_9EURO|nr:uncharacterized protein A1O3_03266 [Capronia epimyces CBS 606.96]EXJ86315.1 hypothetical protein A1O3_03266 [Capronia epimyces CBS 606.96]